MTVATPSCSGVICLLFMSLMTFLFSPADIVRLVFVYRGVLRGIKNYSSLF